MDTSKNTIMAGEEMRDDDEEGKSSSNNNKNLFNDNNASESSKRRRTMEQSTTTAMMNDENDENHEEQQLSMEDILGIPLEILYRQVDASGNGREGDGATGNNNNTNNNSGGKPLLTRSEADQFLKIRLLAQELDALVSLTETVAKNQNQAQQLLTTIKKFSSRNPYVRPILPLLDVLLVKTHHDRHSDDGQSQQRQWGNDEGIETEGRHGIDDKDATLEKDDNKNTISSSSSSSLSSTMYHIHASMRELVHALQECSAQLCHSAEQNWALVDSLLDIVAVAGGRQGDGATSTNNATQVLAREKQALAELEEHVAQRIDTLLLLQQHSEIPQAGIDENNERNENSCRLLFGDGGGEAMSSSQRLSQSSFRASGSGSQRSTSRSNGNITGGADDDRFLSSTDLFTPLAAICGCLFNCPQGNGHEKTIRENNNDLNATITLNEKNGNQNRQQGQPPLRKKCAIVRDGRYSSNAHQATSQNTTDAASTMLSLIHIQALSTQAPDPTVASALEDGNSNRFLLSTDRDDGVATRNNKGFEYLEMVDHGARNEEQQLENSQFPFQNKASAAEALTSLVNGNL